MKVELDLILEWIDSLEPYILETVPRINTYLAESLQDYLKKRQKK